MIRFDPDPATGALETAALLHVEVQVPDRQGGTPETVLGVALELRDSADHPAIRGAGPAPPLNLLENAPAVWSTDFNAPTVPGVYHLRLSIRRRDGPPQVLTVARPLVTVVAQTPMSAGLVYARDGNLWLTSGDGQRTRALTFYLPAVEQATDPAWAPDGRRIAYTHRLPAPMNEIPGREIWSLAAGGTQAQPLVRRRAGEDLFAPAWSPDGRHLLVSVDRIADPATGTVPPGGLLEGTESWAIDTVDLTTGARRPLFTDAREPDVSRDGTWVVYLAVAPVPAGSLDTIPPRLMIAHPDPADPQPRAVLSGAPFQTLASPRISPDGRWIAFAAPNPGGWQDTERFPFPDFALPAAANGVPWDIYVVPATGGTARRVTHLQADGPGVAWGADSRQLAVLADNGLYLVPLEGSAARRLAPGTLHSSLSWYTP